MGDMSWTRYEIPLVAQPSRDVREPSPVPAPSVAQVSRDPRPLAGRGERLIAVILDLFAGLSAFALFMLIATAFGYSVETRPGRLGAAAGVLAVEVVQCVLLTLRGQTLGKVLMGLRIVTYPDGGNPGFLRAVVLRRILTGAIAAVPGVGKIFVWIDCLCIRGDERRCYHDLLANTKVVHDE
jgi:uncharacterized RDD family membrane protein YckC